MDKVHTPKRQTVTINEIPSNFEITRPKFTCDEPLSTDPNFPSFLPGHHYYWCFSAPPKTGKTSTSIGLLTSRGAKKVYRGVFANIIVFMPEESMRSLKKNPFESLDEKKKFHELNAENLMEAYEIIKEFSEDGENSLMYLDDMSSYLKNNDVKQLLNMIVRNRRHLRCSIMNCVQNYNSIPLDNRKLITHLWQGKLTNKKEAENIFSELMFQPKEVYEAILRYTFKKPHDFLYLDIVNNKIYKNWNELNIKSPDNDIYDEQSSIGRSQAPEDQKQKEGEKTKENDKGSK